MMNGTIQKWGNSGAVCLPKTILEMAQLRENDDVEITVVQMGIVIRKAKPRHKSLSERLQGYTGTYAGAEWDTGNPTGSEVL